MDDQPNPTKQIDQKNNGIAPSSDGAQANLIDQSQSNQPIDINKKPHHIFKYIIITIGVLIIAIIAYVAIQWFSFTNQFNGSEQEINKQMAILSLPLGTLTSSKYADGVCFDNCPMMTYMYKLSQPTEESTFDTTISNDLMNHGYKTYVGSGSISISQDDISGGKLNGRYDIDIYPQSILQNNLISTVRVDYSYNPTIN